MIEEGLGFGPRRTDQRGERNRRTSSYRGKRGSGSIPCHDALEGGGAARSVDRHGGGDHARWVRHRRRSRQGGGRPDLDAVV